MYNNSIFYGHSSHASAQWYFGCSVLQRGVFFKKTKQQQKTMKMEKMFKISPENAEEW